MRIEREESIFLLIDVQEKLFPHIYKHQELESSLKKLIEGLLILNVPVIVSEQYTKGLGTTIPSLQTALKEHYQPIEKMTFSCAHDSEIGVAIEQSTRRTIILAGIESHICLLQTAIDLEEEGYDVVVVADAVSSRKVSDKDIALQRLSKHVILTSVESLLFELCQKAGTDEFKAISKLVK